MRKAVVFYKNLSEKQFALDNSMAMTVKWRRCLVFGKRRYLVTVGLFFGKHAALCTEIEGKQCVPKSVLIFLTIDSNNITR